MQKLTAMLVLLSLFSPILAAGNDTKPKAKPLTEDQKIIHVLNRLGFGARPGDVEKVREIGIEKYIDQQLNPITIKDTVAENKVRDLDVFGMSTSELFAKYPNPGALLRQIEGARNKNTKSAENGMVPVAKADVDSADVSAADKKERREKIAELYREYDLKPAAQMMPQVISNRVLRAVYSEKQLQEAMVDFWQNHFNVYSGKGAVRWFIPSYERDVLRPNALGNFKDLLVGTAQHPAMLFFLDNFESVSPNSQASGKGANAQRLQKIIARGGELPPRARERLAKKYGVRDALLDQRLNDMKDAPVAQAKKAKRGINENYARELMELHTLGVDNGYSQADIVEVAKCFTGWTIADPRGYRKIAASTIEGSEERRLGRLQRLQGVPNGVDSGEFYFNAKVHDNSEKTVLGQKINEGGIKDGLKVMDILAGSPATAKFIARKLAKKFVSDNPSDAFVERIADAFHRSGGDIKVTLKTMFMDKEFYAPENYRAKIKTPFELAVSSIRALGADTNASPALLAMLNKLGEVPYGYQAPTGYPDTAEDWVNTGALLERLNFAVAVSSNRIPGTKVDLKGYEAKDKAQVLDLAIKSILDGDVSAATRSNLLKQLEQPLPEVKAGSEISDAGMSETAMNGGGKKGGGQNRQGRLMNPSGNPDVFKAVSLVLGSPEFQRQ